MLEKCDRVEGGGLVVAPGLSVPVPVVVAQTSEKAGWRFVEFFIAHLENGNTRKAYRRAVYQFLDWCGQTGVQDLMAIRFTHVATYREVLLRSGKSAPTVNQHLAALRQCFEWLVEGRVLQENPAKSVKGPKHKVKEGKTPVLELEDLQQLFSSFDTSQVIGLRDRALIGVMFFTFARVGAVVAMNVEDYFIQGKRAFVRLHEKGGKYLKRPVHHLLEEYLDQYIEAAADQLGDEWEKQSPLFPSTRGRSRKLSQKRISANSAWYMVQRRGLDAQLETRICNHSFRGSGITNYLENGGSLDIAQEMAAHEDPRTTKLYDRRREKLSQTEIERIRIF